MTPERDAIFSLLRCALTGDTEPAQVYDCPDWQRLFLLLQQNHVAALASEAFGHLHEGQKPPRQVLIPWLSEREKAIAWQRHQKEVQQEIVDLMLQHGIDTLVLKGATLAQYYPNPSLREYSDLDLYFYDHHDEADRMAQEHLGVQVSNDAHHHSKYNYRGVTVESHYDFVNRHTPPSNKEFELILKSEAPGVTYELLFLLRHMAGHFASSRITLRDLIDWHLLSSAHRHNADWNKVARHIETSGMAGFTEALNTIARQRFGTTNPLPSNANPELTDRIENDIIYGTLDDHREENLHRLAWKLRRYRANRWKHHLTYRHDSAMILLLSSIGAHAAKPRSILHKM